MAVCPRLTSVLPDTPGASLPIQQNSTEHGTTPLPIPVQCQLVTKLCGVRALCSNIFRTWRLPCRRDQGCSKSRIWMRLPAVGSIVWASASPRLRRYIHQGVSLILGLVEVYAPVEVIRPAHRGGRGILQEGRKRRSPATTVARRRRPATEPAAAGPVPPAAGAMRLELGLRVARQ